MLKWTVREPKVSAEGDAAITTVEADTLEEAIEKAARELKGFGPSPGDRYFVYAAVEVGPRTTLNLRSY